ncbi:MAG: translation initiation factor IF-2 [Halobacteriota archaeon]|nr:translation initiation factor IF-2 [Halobacteriota archaeon]
MAEDRTSLRTPIVCVMGHVDHGKTTLLDRIRGSSIVEKESGAITQHIGATEIPVDVIEQICSSLTSKSFKVPGLLFIDTPGHHAFTTLRSRGGALADLAVVIVDIMESFQPQTFEVLRILRNFKTPFIVAANKIDRLHGWYPEQDAPFMQTFKNQSERVQQMLDEKTYRIIEKLSDEGFSSDRYDRIRDFQRNIGVIPLSAKTGEGIPDLLMILMGLAQRFLEDDLRFHAKGPGIGSVLEVKEEKGLGLTLDVILYDGELKKGDTIVVGGKAEPVVTKVRALLKPNPLSELRIADKFLRVDSVTAASGVKVAAPNLGDVLAGLPLHVVKEIEEIDSVVEVVKSEQELKIETDNVGVVIKADTIGSLEALAIELLNAGVPIKKADVGDISKRDVIEASAIKDPLLSAILGFNVEILPDAREEMLSSDLQVFVSEVIYTLIEDFEEWKKKEEESLYNERFGDIVMPGKILLLPDCTFRISKPAVVGVEVLGGEIKTGLSLINKDGSRVGLIKGIQDKGENIGSADYRAQVAVAIDRATVGRQIKEGDILYVEIPESDSNVIETELYGDLSTDASEAFEEFLEIKRRNNPFWGK